VSGIAKCAACGGSLVAFTRDGSRFTGQGAYTAVLPVSLSTPSVVTPAGSGRFRLTVPLRTVYRRAA
jgi:hypothetical protein